MFPCLRQENTTRGDLLRQAARRLLYLRAGEASSQRSASSQTVEADAGRRDYYWLLVLAAAGAAIVFGLVWLSRTSPKPPSTVVEKVTARPVATPSSTAAEPRHDYSRSVSRLSDALNSVPGKSPEEVLKTVTAKTRDCAFEWSNGQPSLVFGANRSISTTLDRCADAVERHRPAAGRSGRF